MFSMSALRSMRESERLAVDSASDAPPKMKMSNLVPTILAMSFVLVTNGSAQNALNSEEKLAADFWAWRARTGQYTSDEVTRIERPAGVMRDWSAASVEKQRRNLTVFEERWKKLGDKEAPVWQQVDHRLLGSGLARVRWELDVLDRCRRDPNFYIEQTLTPVGEALTIPGPYDEEQSREILARLNNIPAILDQAKQNLSSPPAPYAQMAIESLAGIRSKLETMASTLASYTTVPAATLHVSEEAAATSLERYRAWLEKILPSLPGQAAIGREKYVWFLRNVALMPYEPEELVSWAEQEWRRAVAFEGLEQDRNRSVPPLGMAATTEEFVERNQKAELAVREFLENGGIRTVPSWLQHFTLRPMPPYLAALGDFVEMDDFTSPSRLDQNGIRYVTPPSPTAGYFWVADAKDPRIQIVHEGTVGHYGQLCASWRNSDPIRRHYYDSGANEDLGFYAEEMMLQSGLYDDSPHTREIVYNQMRLRALRVITDVKLALGTFTPKEAVDFMQRNVPMRRKDRGSRNGRDTRAEDLVPDWKTTDRANAIRGSKQAGQAVQPPGVPRLRMAERKHTLCAAEMGVSGDG